MPVLYGDTLYNAQAVSVAALTSDNSYSAPVPLRKLEQFRFAFEADTDEIQTGGLMTDLLTVTTHGTATLSNAAFNYEALLAMLGTAVVGSESGSTPNQSATVDLLVGGAGLGYFGLIGLFTSQDGANVLAGLPKAMLTEVPGVNVGQNQFRRVDVPLRFIAPSTTVRKACRIVLNESAASVPTDASGFAAFFNGLF